MPFKQDRFRPLAILTEAYAKMRTCSRQLTRDFLTPLSVIQQYRQERQRYSDAIDDAMATRYIDSEPLHRPKQLDITAYALAACSFGILKWALTWLFAQVLLSLAVTLSHGSFLALKTTLKMPLCDFLIATDVVIFSALVLMVIASVRIYGPTSVGFGLTLSLAETTGAPYRAALRSFPKTTQTREVQIEQWRYTKIYVSQLARALGRRRLLQIVTALATMALCWASLSFWLSAQNRSLLYLNAHPLTTQHTLITHLYFLFIMFATIGLGDVTFRDSWFGHLIGILVALTVMGTGVGLGAYLNYYVLSLRERLYAYLISDVTDGVDWLIQGVWMI